MYVRGLFCCISLFIAVIAPCTNIAAEVADALIAEDQAAVYNSEFPILEEYLIHKMDEVIPLDTGGAVPYATRSCPAGTILCERGSYQYACCPSTPGLPGRCGFSGVGVVCGGDPKCGKDQFFCPGQKFNTCCNINPNLETRCVLLSNGEPACVTVDRGSGDCDKNATRCQVARGDREYICCEGGQVCNSEQTPQGLKPVCRRPYTECAPAETPCYGGTANPPNYNVIACCPQGITCLGGSCQTKTLDCGRYDDVCSGGGKSICCPSTSSCELQPNTNFPYCKRDEEFADCIKKVEDNYQTCIKETCNIQNPGQNGNTQAETCRQDCRKDANDLRKQNCCNLPQIPDPSRVYACAQLDCWNMEIESRKQCLETCRNLPRSQESVCIRSCYDNPPDRVTNCYRSISGEKRFVEAPTAN